MMPRTGGARRRFNMRLIETSTRGQPSQSSVESLAWRASFKRSR